MKKGIESLSQSPMFGLIVEGSTIKPEDIKCCVLSEREKDYSDLKITLEEFLSVRRAK